MIPDHAALADKLRARLDRAVSDYIAAPTPRAAKRFEAQFRAWTRHDAAAINIRKTAFTRDELAYIQEEITDSLGDRAARRRAEHELAEYMAGCGHQLQRPDLHALSESMALCRVRGCCGVTSESHSLRVAWDHKCGQDRLCPDEARERTQALAERMVPELQRQLSRHKDARVFFAVFTCPNFEPGRLAHGMQFIQKRWTDFLQAKRDCTDDDRRRYGYARSKRKVPEWQPAARQRDDDGKLLPYDGPGILGSVTTLEAPLSPNQARPWNVHLNALLVVRGRFDFKRARELWGFNVELREVKGDGKRSLIRACLELLKYAAQLTPEKSTQHAKRGDAAPAMTEWPPERFAEWYDAHRRFRRVRSYGALYGVHKPEPEPPEAVEWLGLIEFNDAGQYCVDLIPDDKSRDSQQQKPAPGYRVPDLRPPDRRCLH